MKNQILRGGLISIFNAFTTISLLLIFPYLFENIVFAAEWYADTTAQGSANGTSWDNAWALSGVPWSSLESGSTDHTLYINGGSSGLTYSREFGIRHNTTSNRLYIKPGSASPYPSGHDGLVTFGSQITMENGVNAIYTTIDGKKNNISTDRNFRSTSPYNGVYFGYEYVHAYVTIKYIEFYQVASYNPDGQAAGVWIAGGSPNSDIIIEYNYFNGTRQKGVRGTGAMTASPNNTIIRHNIFMNGCDDDVAISLGFTLDNNVFDQGHQSGCTDYGQHPDGVQSDWTDPQSIVIKNNFYRDHTQEIFIEADCSTGSACSIKNVWIYNNVFDDRTSSATSPFIIMGPKGTNTCTIDNLIIANNTMVGTSMVDFRLGGDTGTINITNSKFVNNILLGSTGTIWLDSTGTVNFTDSGFQFDYNIVSDPKGFQWLYGGSTKRNYSGTDTAQWSVDHATLTHNKVSAPSLVNKAGYDYHLQSGDTVAKDAGMNMSSYFTTDKEGRTRPQGTAWDIGAYELTSTPTGKVPSPPSNILVQ